jgi:hypothetical protein
MTIEDLLDSLVRRGVRLTATPSKLIAEPASKLTWADRAAIHTHRPVLLTYLRGIALAREAEAAGIDLVDYLKEHAPDLLRE